MKTFIYDYIVIGSGIAGLSATQVLAECGTTAVITKGTIKSGSTHLAQGGIAVAIKETDTTTCHYQDTITAGDGLCDPDAVRVLVEEGPARVQELIALGAQFDKVNGEYELGREGAHQERRILHAGDATGKEIEKTLGNHCLQHDNVTFYSQTFVIELIVKNGACIGCFALLDGEIVCFKTTALFLATGGAGQVYIKNTNPPVATGDGIALGIRAGASVQDMEFVQFHPTTLFQGDKKPISLFLISEAVRGEGALLRNSNGDRFMQRYHPLAELAPRDIVSRAIYKEIRTTGSVYLDLTVVNKDLKHRFPTIYSRCLEAGYDITKDWIPVSPGAHYVMGGIKTDLMGQTSIDGLYAIGEVASLGIHGANRLASNSLLDGLVFGHKAACHARDNKRELVAYDLEFFGKLAESKSPAITGLKQKLRKAMWDFVGIERDMRGLNEMMTFIKKQSWVFELCEVNEIKLEFENMLIVSNLMVLAALKRQESRGAHFRLDFTEKNDAKWGHHIELSASDCFFDLCGLNS